MTSSQTPASSPTENHRQTLLLSGILFLLIGAIYAIHFSPALYYDDWNLFAYNYFKDALPWFLKDFIRPLTYATYRLQTELFGFNLNALMAWRIFLLSLEGALFFTILQKLRVFSAPVNFICALIMLFSPEDMTRTWLVLDPLVVVFLQVYFLLLIVYLQKKNLAAFIASLVFGFAMLLYYEAQLGLVMAFPVVCFIYYWLRNREKRWLLLLPVLLGLFFLAYRVAGPLFGIDAFHTSQAITLVNILRQVRNALVCFFLGWINPIRMDAVIRFTALAALFAAAAAYLYHVIRYGFEKDNRKRLARAGILLAVGGLLWLAGYFPWIAFGVPSYIHWFNTRAHTFAIPGSVICLLAVLELAGSLVRVSPQQKTMLAVILVLPFLAVGVQSQLAIQRETKILWQDYQAMWKGVFSAAPNFKGNPHVVLIINPGTMKLRYGERDFYTIASYNTEISRALSMFYDGQELEGEFMFENMEFENTPTIHDNGIRNPPTYSGTIPYSDIVFIRFDRSTDAVIVIRDLKKEFGIFAPHYKPDRFIDQKPPSGKTMRYIFGEDKGLRGKPYWRRVPHG